MNELKNREYWNKRVEDGGDLNMMVWTSVKIDSHLKWFTKITETYKECTVLDIGCGWGRIAPLFKKEKYFGVDFSEKMIEIAKDKYPENSFEVGDASTYIPMKKYDIILAFHLSILPAAEKEFIERYRPYADKAILLVYNDRIVNISPNL